MEAAQSKYKTFFWNGHLDEWRAADVYIQSELCHYSKNCVLWVNIEIE